MSADTEFLERLVFDDSSPQEWAQDVWDLNPILGERAAKLVEILALLAQHYPPGQLRVLVASHLGDRLDLDVEE
ncbi:MAG: hypothetical protein AAFY11_00215 [Cyanobacteria bacterium J06641_5]